MKDNNFWLQQAVYKLNQLHMNGSAFKEELWEPEWDHSVTIEENSENDGSYGMALMTLMQANVVNAVYRPNMEGEDPSIYAWYLEQFDYDRFLRFCDTYGFSLHDKGKQSTVITKDAREEVSAAPSSPTLTMHKLEPKHYNQRTGKLALSATTELPLAAKGKVTRPNGKKYLQCLVMEKVFKGVNTVRNGVTFSTILGVSESKMNKDSERKISNTVNEINKKVASVGGPKKLILIQKGKVFVNHSYLYIA